MEQTCRMLALDDSLPCRHYIRANDNREPGFCRQPNKFRCDEAMKKKLPSISFSRLVDFIHCKKRYKHAVLDGLKVKAEHLPEPLKLGTAWDIFIRSLYK